MLIKLPEPFKTQWLAALRDPNTTQTTGKLYRFRDDPYGHYVGMCCLGVAANVLDPNEWSPLSYYKTWRVSDNDLTSGLIPGNPMEDQIYKALMQEGPSGCQSVEAYLIEMNDVGKTFPKIADWIEENL